MMVSSIYHVDCGMMQVGEILDEIVSSAQPDIGNDDLARGSPDTADQAHGLTESEKDVRFFLPLDFVFFFNYSSLFIMNPNCITAIFFNNVD